MGEERNDRGGTLESRVGSWVLKGTGLLLTAAAALAIIRPADPNINYRRPIVLLGFVLALSAAVAVDIVTRHRPRRGRVGATTRHALRLRLVAAVTSVVGGVAGYLLAQPIRFTYGWDAGVVTNFSRELSSGLPLSDYAQDYLSRYPNNVPVIAMMNVARGIGGPTDGDMYGAYLAGNGVCLAMVLFATFVLVSRLRSTAPAFIAQMAVFGLVGCSPWMAVPYTDIPAMPFLTVAVTLAALAAGAGPRRGFGLVIAAFAIAGGALVLKSTPASIAVAFALVLLLVLVAGSAPGRARVGAALVCGVMTFGLSALACLAVADNIARIDRQQLDTSRTPPVTWWLANGLITTENKGRCPYYGAYSPTMVKESMYLSGENLRKWSDARLAHQVSTMGPVGILRFEVRKYAFNWGDGMFFAWGAFDYEPKRLHRHDATAKAVQSWQHARGQHYPLRAGLTNGAWLAIVLWAGVGLLRARYRRDLLVVAVSVLGIGLFTLVFQGGSRYLLAFVPVIVALAAGVDPLARSRRRHIPG